MIGARKTTFMDVLAGRKTGKAADVLFPWANLVRSAFWGVIGAEETTFINALARGKTGKGS